MKIVIYENLQKENIFKRYQYYLLNKLFFFIKVKFLEIFIKFIKL